MIPLGAGFWLIFHSDKPYFAGWLYDSPAIGWTGTALTAAGLLFTVWARTHLGKYWSGIITLKQVHKLIRTGPYRIVRHPIYTGFLTAALGSAIRWSAPAIVHRLPPDPTRPPDQDPPRRRCPHGRIRRRIRHVQERSRRPCTFLIVTAFSHRAPISHSWDYSLSSGWKPSATSGGTSWDHLSNGKISVRKSP